MKLLCRLGIHGQWYHDSAMFSSAERCGHCNAGDDKYALRMLERERSLWGDAEGETLEDRLLWVLKRLYDYHDEVEVDRFTENTI